MEICASFPVAVISVVTVSESRATRFCLNAFEFYEVSLYAFSYLFVFVCIFDIFLIHILLKRCNSIFALQGIIKH